MTLTTLNTDIAAHFFHNLAPRYDLRSNLPTINAPTLVVVGHHDWVCPPAAGRLVAAAIPGARLIELSEAGHFGFSETPTPFLAAVRTHLANVTTQPARNDRRTQRTAAESSPPTVRVDRSAAGALA